ncbi:hypothetical protein NKR23_g7913 [Pleurostoma richardsiae]|uniref:Uncharacterized protein n=1 Tax=Pleurostoma richardsiae TaxID=41990 RepID=A0AA38VM70_9PEZI|nr:hypothetical protein NKR23_g7913 [Pleurostoma richardsiae]
MNSVLTEQALFVAQWMKPTLLPVLENLQRLHLAVELTARDPHHPLDTPGNVLNLNIRRLLNYTKNLKWLRINFQHRRGQTTDLFLRWLALPALAHVDKLAAPACNVDLLPVDLPALERLDLGSTSVSLRILRSVIMKWASTLKSLSLWSIDIQSDSSMAWAKLFADLSQNEAVSIKHITVGRIGLSQQRWGQPAFSRPYVLFKAQDADKPAQSMVELRGTAAEIFAELARDVIDWPPRADHGQADIASSWEDSDSNDD